jgi:hypothetical protein
MALGNMHVQSPEGLDGLLLTGKSLKKQKSVETTASTQKYT